MMDSIPSETPPPNLHELAEDHYFKANPPPKDLAKHTELARDFINFHAAAGRPLVLVTSGGTTVPLGECCPGRGCDLRRWLTGPKRSRRCGSLTTSRRVPAVLYVYCKLESTGLEG